MLREDMAQIFNLFFISDTMNSTCDFFDAASRLETFFKIHWLKKEKEK